MPAIPPVSSDPIVSQKSTSATSGLGVVTMAATVRSKSTLVSPGWRRRGEPYAWRADDLAPVDERNQQKSQDREARQHHATEDFERPSNSFKVWNRNRKYHSGRGM